MKRYSFLLYHRDYDKFLKDLQGMGVVHVIENNKQSAELLRDRYQILQQFDRAIRFLKKRNAGEPDVEPAGNGFELLEKVQDLQQQLELDIQQRLNIEKERDLLLPWGEFSPETLAKLRQRGVHTRFFSCHTRKFNEQWEKDYQLSIINEQESLVYFVVFQDESKEPITIQADEFKIQEKSPAKLKQQFEEFTRKIEISNLELDKLAAKAIPMLEHARNEADEALQLDRVKLNTEKQAEDRVRLVIGWVPTTAERELVQFLENNEILFIEEKPEEGENPPILLKNNRFAKLFEPIGKLFALPNYQEMDLTPMFAPFFMMFFGFCLGDAGYGLVILLAASILKLKARPDLRPVLTLAQFLGLGTILFGIISGTLFGVNLIESDIKALEGVKEWFLGPDSMFNLALGVGLAQILFGMCVKVVNTWKQKGWAYAMSTLGAIVLILALLDTFMLHLTGKVATYVIYGSLAIIVYFSDPKASIFGRLGKGIWELYGVTGVFGDVLSYIRLFALGISSSILGFVVNDIALQIKGAIPVLGPVLFVLFLIIGHTANLAIAALGSFVHPMRLTFLEFYKNAGFAGGGKEYKPFSYKQ